MTKASVKGRYHKSSSHWVKVQFIDGLWWITFMFSLTRPHQDEIRVYDTWPAASDAIVAWVERGDRTKGQI